MEKKAIGINLRAGHLVKRLWFEVSSNKEAEEKFMSLARQINQIDSCVDLKDLIKQVQTKFEINGFFRIAK